MTRRLAERPPRRLLRMRPATHRPEHGLDQALVEQHCARRVRCIQLDKACALGFTHSLAEAFETSREAHIES